MTKKQPENGVEAPDSTEPPADAVLAPIGELSTDEQRFIALWRGDDYDAFMGELSSIMMAYTRAHQEAAHQAVAEIHAELEQRAAAERAERIAEDKKKPLPPPVPFPSPVPQTTVHQRTDDDPYPSETTLNFRRAFAVVGVLISDGYIDVDFEDDHLSGGWWNDFDVLVNDVAAALNITAM